MNPILEEVLVRTGAESATPGAMEEYHRHTLRPFSGWRNASKPSSQKQRLPQPANAALLNTSYLLVGEHARLNAIGE